MSEIRYLEAINDGHREVLEKYDEAFIMGEDVEIGILGATTGLVDDFGSDRVRNTPISEEAFTGLGVGAAMEGKRPIVEYEINTLIHTAWDQLVNHAQKIHYMSNGDVSVPLTITNPLAGVPGGSAAQHSDSPYPALMNFGMKNVIPSTPYDAKGLFHSAVAENDPVVVSFPAKLHGMKGEVPDEPYEVPLGEARVARPGDDVTIIAVGEMVRVAESVAEEMASEVSIEVIDPRTLLPLDEETLFASVRKTGRVLAVDNSLRTCGAAAEILARIGNHCFWDLEAPLKRVTRADVPASYAPPEETAIVPDETVVENAVRDLI